ncbi:MAG: septum formation initiator family protein [Candidatus Acidiferrales bacterium]|jgi:cell division protein FtsB
MTVRGSQTQSFWQRHGGTVLVLLVLFLLVHDVFGTHGFLAMRRAQKEIQRLRDEVTKLNQENLQLEDQVKGLRSDPKLIERIARDELGLARPGEIIIKIPAPAQSDPAKP